MRTPVVPTALHSIAVSSDSITQLRSYVLCVMGLYTLMCAGGTCPVAYSATNVFRTSWAKGQLVASLPYSSPPHDLAPLPVPVPTFNRGASPGAGVLER